MIQKFSRRTALLAATASMILVACGDSQASMPKSQELSIALLKKEAKGRELGQATSPNELFVFFDASCGHCARFWVETKKYPNAKVTWIPIQLLGPGSLAQGALFLEAEDPVAWMDKHSAEVISGVRSPTTLKASNASRAAVAHNQALFDSVAGTGVPYLVGMQANGELFKKSGGLPIENLASILGWK